MKNKINFFINFIIINFTPYLNRSQIHKGRYEYKNIFHTFSRLSSTIQNQ